MHCFQQFYIVSAEFDCVFENKLIFIVHVFAETSLQQQLLISGFKFHHCKILKPDTYMTEVESHSHFAKIVDCKEQIF